ncbi:MAG: hypothetical protein ACKO3S_03540 [bacterium]
MFHRRRFLVPLALVLLALVVGGPALAQLPPPPPPGGDPQRLRDEIERTERRIQQARDLVAAAPANEVASAELERAVTLQGIARTAYADARYAMAGRATKEARIHADRAIALVQGLPDPGRVQDQMQRTREMLERARDRLARCEQPAAREVLRTALDMQSRAEAAYAETRYLAALQLTSSARERALRAQQMCNAGESLEEAVGAALQRTDDRLARAREVVGARGTERARRLLENAEGLQARAKVEAQAQRTRAAMRLTRMAREQAERALRDTARSERP